MLFTTATFLCLFLPVTLVGFFVIARFGHGAAALWLFLASVVFYGYWMPEFTVLLLSSIIGNYVLGTRISALADSTDTHKHEQAKRWLLAGITVNIALLSYYKYANFFVGNLNAVLGFNWDIGRVILPIGISFFTFTQIAYLVDTWRKGTREHKFVHYGLFVTYFPHLIAGPVLHHAQMMPQFGQAETYRFNTANFSAGLVIFALGLFKKVVLADGVSPYADAIFLAADGGAPRRVFRKPGWVRLLTRYNSILTFQATLTWPLGCRGCSTSGSHLILTRRIRLPISVTFGAGGICPCRSSCAITSISRSEEIATVPYGAMPI